MFVKRSPVGSRVLLNGRAELLGLSGEQSFRYPGAILVFAACGFYVACKLPVPLAEFRIKAPGRISEHLAARRRGSRGQLRRGSPPFGTASKRFSPLSLSARQLKSLPFLCERACNKVPVSALQQSMQKHPMMPLPFACAAGARNLHAEVGRASLVCCRDHCIVPRERLLRRRVCREC